MVASSSSCRARHPLLSATGLRQDPQVEQASQHDQPTGLACWLARAFNRRGLTACWDERGRVDCDTPVDCSDPFCPEAADGRGPASERLSPDWRALVGSIAFPSGATEGSTRATSCTRSSRTSTCLRSSGPSAFGALKAMRCFAPLQAASSICRISTTPSGRTPPYFQFNCLQLILLRHAPVTLRELESMPRS